MDADELVRSIAKEVLKQLQGQETRDCIMVLADRGSSSAEKLREWFDEEADILYFGEDTRGMRVDRYILPFLSCSGMADLAGGRADGEYMSEVLKLLLQGVEVETLEFAYQAYRDTAPGPLYRLYESHMETLAAFGLIPFQPKRPDSVRFWDSLVTEKVVERIGQQGASVLMVPVAAQVTPLAKDAAKSLRITIEKCL